MALGHVLDNGQPETGSPGLPGTAPVHPVKALCQARQVVSGDAWSRVVAKNSPPPSSRKRQPASIRPPPGV
uniref:Uncharacterized protein n=1 Tax=uncultured microorganism TaxID=358574 RepID=F8UGW3_9ZZZZ|nr:hypothetical protein LDC_03284 [uncultured microorganism]